MATHFARGILTEGHLISVRLPSQCHQEARNIPPHHRHSGLAQYSRGGAGFHRGDNAAGLDAG